MATAAVNKPGVAVQEKVETSPSISWQEFEQQYLNREDLFKYEWVRGTVVNPPREMNQYQYFILLNIQRWFNRLKQAEKVSGELLAEVDTFFQKNVHRRPDISWFDDAQLARMAHHQNEVPKFVIEIISGNDIMDNLLDKLKDYREAGVEVVWLVSPKLEQVHVYTANGSDIYTSDLLCSAAPALPGFVMSVHAIFKKPELPAEQAV